MNLRNALLTTVCLAAVAAFLSEPAFADDAAILQRLDAMQKMIDAQQQQIQAQKSEIGELKQALAKKPAKTTVVSTTSAPAPQELQAQVTAQQVKIDRLTAKLDDAQTAARIEKQEQPVWSMPGGRPTITSSDGRFSLALRLLGQFDTAYYSQSGAARELAAANGPDLSSGQNFRRAQIGFQGKLFGDWSYFFNTEFGGSNGFESQGRVQSLYIQYDGLRPFSFRIGAYPPSGGLEDNTSSSDTLFLERASPSDMLRNAVGGDGRDAATIAYTGDEFYAALSYTGSKVADTATFDEQSALLARISDSLYSDANARIVISASAAYLFKAPDTTQFIGAPRTVTMSAAPELTVDSNGTKLISTGAIDTESLTIWGVEAGATWQNFYAQGGYFHYGFERRNSALSDLDFSGWYMQASWVLTGESKGYNTTNAAFTPPKPRVNFSLAGGGWGAWELAARYSDVDLNDNEGVLGAPVPLNGIRGGEEKIWTVGLNWYPNAVLRFAFDYQRIDVDRLGTIPALAGVHGVINNAQVGQTVDAFSLRSQISL